MKKMIVLMVILVGGAFINSCATKPSRMRLEDLAENKLLGRPEQMLSWLQNCKNSCASPDNDIAGLLHEGYSELFAIAKESPNYRQMTDDQRRRAAEGKIKVRQGFTEIIKTKETPEVLSIAYKALSERDGSYAEGPEFAQVVRESVTRLKSKKSTEAAGWYLQALSEKQTLATLSALSECVKLDPKETLCRDEHQYWSKVFERPWCDNKRLSKNGKLFMRQILPGKRSQQVNLPKKEIENIYFDAFLPDTDVLGMTLTSKKMQELKVKFEGMNKIDMTFINNDQSLSVGLVRVSPQASRIAVDFPRGKAGEDFFKKLCPVAMQNRVPDNLRLR